MVVAGVILGRWIPRFSKLLFFIAFTWLYISSTPFFSELIAGSLEAQNPPVKIENIPYAKTMVVLGGGINGVVTPRKYPELNDAADRLWFAARLYQAGKSERVLLTGGTIPWIGMMNSEAKSMAELIQRWGVSSRALMLEGKSRNTYENAINSRFLVPSNQNKILLVTSALHMPRAKAVFERQGFDVFAVTTDINVTNHSRTVLDYLPSADALALTTRAIKEHLGMLYYWHQGWVL